YARRKQRNNVNLNAVSYLKKSCLYTSVFILSNPVPLTRNGSVWRSHPFGGRITLNFNIRYLFSETILSLQKDEAFARTASHVLHNRFAEFRTLHFFRAFHEPRKVVRYSLLLYRLVQPL